MKEKTWLQRSLVARGTSGVGVRRCAQRAMEGHSNGGGGYTGLAGFSTRAPGAHPRGLPICEAAALAVT